MKKLAIALAFATILASPALAQSTTRAKAKVVQPPVITWPFGAYAQSPPSTTMLREQAIQQCNTEARLWWHHAYGHQEFDRYRACMNAHGYVE